MKKYEVCVDYTASKIYEVEADNEDQAASIAFKQAMEDAPYVGLSITLGYVDEAEE